MSEADELRDTERRGAGGSSEASEDVRAATRRSPHPDAIEVLRVCVEHMNTDHARQALDDVLAQLTQAREALERIRDWNEGSGPFTGKHAAEAVAIADAALATINREGETG